ncbi:MAG: peptidyl-prolyl cis-trans isomerase [Thermoleophilia bacterium]|nr:peptidyl-prolyl cis-trans isomerase [Thermoleophilia bacterium]
MSGVRKLGLIIFGGLLVLLFAGFAIGQGITQPSVPDGDIAVVEEVPDGLGNISQEDYDRSFEQTWRRGGLNAEPQPGDAQYDQVRETAIGDLLDRAWLTGEASELGIQASDREVANEFATVRNDQFRDDAAFKKFLKDSNFTVEEVRDRVRLQVLSTKIQDDITGGITEVSDDEAEKFYEASKDNFATPESRDIRLVVTDDEADAEKAKAELDKGSDDKQFAKVAKQYSTQGSSAQGGKTVATEGAFPDPAGSEIMSAPENEVIGPVEGGGQFYVFKVVGVTEAETPTIDDVRDQIEQQLLPSLQQRVMAEFVSDYNAKWTSRTFCAPDYTISRCANFEGDGRIETADPACYEEGAADADPPLSCPAPVALPSPIEPGGNAGTGALNQGIANLPQGPVPPGDAADAAAQPPGAPGAIDPATGAPTGAAGGDAAAQQAAAAQAAAAQAAAQAAGQ